MYRPVMWNAFLRVRLMTVPILALALVLAACGGQDTQESANKGSEGEVDGQIAFRTWLDPDQTEGALFTMNPDGSHIRQITHPPNGWRDDDPVWSPNGESIVFYREKIDESTSWLTAVNPDTGDTH